MSLKQNFYGQTNCFNSLCLVKMCKRGKTLYMMMPIDFWCVCLESFILLFVPYLLILYFIQTTIWTLTNIERRLNSDSWGETAQQCSLASALTVQKQKWRQRKLPARVRMHIWMSFVREEAHVCVLAGIIKQSHQMFCRNDQNQYSW